jgi:hypothetical protein
MLKPAARRFSMVALCATFATFAPGCGDSPTDPDPVQQTESFTGTLQPLGSDFKTFSIAYAVGVTDLSVTVNSLTSVASATPVTGITIGIGIGTVSGSSCAAQIQATAAPLNQELFAPNGASAGSYCVVLSDCPTGTTGCTPTLPEAVNYTMTVKHY